MVVMTQRHYTIPRSYKEIVGAIVFYWATMEHVLVDIIGETMGIDVKARRILLAKMDPKAKIAMLKVIGSKYVKNKSIRSDVNALAKICHGLYDLRNKVAHGAWVHPVGSPGQYDLLVIDSGESAYLPKRLTISKSSSTDTIASFDSALQCAKVILSQILTDKGTQKVKDGKGSVSGSTEGAMPLEVPKDISHSAG